MKRKYKRKFKRAEPKPIIVKTKPSENDLLSMELRRQLILFDKKVPKETFDNPLREFVKKKFRIKK